MNSNLALVRALRGPVMMMTLGGMLVADHFTRFGFGRTWPVLLIVLGIMKLLERTGVSSEPANPYTPMGGK
ncbi:MAG TPA: hypothetical protein VFB63_09250 [Bryobacteraceae bacterium]|jgi:hypothetical protein|nr:hypothetical protein [Bryobacteraceae bacterium]